MTAPSLSKYVNGLSTVTADQLNTMMQTCDNVAQLRAFVGITGIEVTIRGYTAIGDGGQGTFYWNASGTAADDGGVTTVVPNGATLGCWIRIANNTVANTGAVATNASFYIPFLATNTSTPQALNTTSALYFNPSTGALSATVFGGAGTFLTGTAASLNIGGTAANLSGTPALPNGTAATTQTTGDNTTKLATTAFANAAAAAAIAGDIKSINVQVIVASGTYTPSTGMKYCFVEICGGGGGGNAWGGGGGSGYNRTFFSAATIGASKAVVIGAGGAGSSGGGSNGGDSTFGSTLAISHSGGGASGSYGGGTGGAASQTGNGYSINGGNGTTANATYPGSQQGGSSLFGSTSYGSGGAYSGNGQNGICIITEFLTV